MYKRIVTVFIASLAILVFSPVASAKIEIHAPQFGNEIRQCRVMQWNVTYNNRTQNSVVTVWLKKDRIEFQITFSGEHLAVGLLVSKDLGKKIDVWKQTARRPMKIGRNPTGVIR